MNTLKTYNFFSRLPLGKWIFAKILGCIAPYFSTINPRVEKLKPGICVVTIKDRRKIRNHLGSIHAGALCNLAELAGGLTLDVTLNKQWRWIPTGMTIQYLKKAHGPLLAQCEIDANSLQTGQTSAVIEIRDQNDVMIAQAKINFNIKVKEK